MAERSFHSSEIDPARFVALFEAGARPADPFSGVCGRVVRGRNEGDFTRLAFASGRRLAWLTGAEGLRAMLGQSPTEIVLGIGKTRAWLAEKLTESMQWKLIVIPQAQCFRADWQGVFSAIEAHYPDVTPKLSRWQGAVRDPQLASRIDPSLVTGAVKDDVGHPLHMTPERYLAASDTAQNARLFLWHSVGLNDQYTGDGWTSGTEARVDEYLTLNVPLAEIPGHRVIDLPISERDVRSAPRSRPAPDR